jgi:hypothetical protein
MAGNASVANPKAGPELNAAHYGGLCLQTGDTPHARRCAGVPAIPLVPHGSSFRQAETRLARGPSSMQALDRTQLALPLRPGLPERQTHDYGRHGTTTLEDVR